MFALIMALIRYATRSTLLFQNFGIAIFKFKILKIKEDLGESTQMRCCKKCNIFMIKQWKMSTFKKIPPSNGKNGIFLVLAHPADRNQNN